MSAARREYPCIVVGLGGIGSAAAYWLARRGGDRVLGLERFEFGHDRGASQDHSRIIRLSYHTPLYVELAREAYAAWAALEDDAGRRLIVRTGGLDLWPPGAAIPMSDYTDSLAACGVEHELLDAGGIVRRWPVFVLDEDVIGLYQSEGGIAPAARCNATHVELGRGHGATLRDRTPVTAVRAAEGEYVVETGDGSFACERLVIAADAWTNQILEHLGASLPLTVTQEQVTYWAPRDDEAFGPERFPVWIWMDDPSFYGFPVFGAPGVKAGQDVGGREVTADTRTFEPDPAALERVSAWMRAHLPSALGRLLYTKTCLYTMPPDRDLVVDRVPGHEHAFVALGAAHGFKFASLLGSMLADLALEGETEHPIEAFRATREVLRQRDPERSFLV